MLMQPNGPMPTPPPIQAQGGANPYAFITNPGKAPKKGLLPGGNSKQGRLFVVIGIAVGLLTIGVIAAVVISSIGSSQKADWLSIAQQQQELIRVSDLGSKAQSRDVKNLATTTNLSLLSSQATVNSLAKKNGAVVNTKTLALGKSSKTDAELKTAEQTNQFDKTFKEVLKQELNDYQRLLKKLYDGSGSKSTKAGLSTAYTNAGLLATQANQ